VNARRRYRRLLPSGAAAADAVLAYFPAGGGGGGPEGGNSAERAARQAAAAAAVASAQGAAYSAAALAAAALAGAMPGGVCDAPPPAPPRPPAPPAAGSQALCSASAAAGLWQLSLRFVTAVSNEAGRARHRTRNSVSNSSNSSGAREMGGESGNARHSLGRPRRRFLPVAVANAAAAGDWGAVLDALSDPSPTLHGAVGSDGGSSGEGEAGAAGAAESAAEEATPETLASDEAVSDAAAAGATWDLMAVGKRLVAAARARSSSALEATLHAVALRSRPHVKNTTKCFVVSSKRGPRFDCRAAF
jgi:hypothetical protein